MSSDGDAYTAQTDATQSQAYSGYAYFSNDSGTANPENLDLKCYEVKFSPSAINPEEMFPLTMHTSRAVAASVDHTDAITAFKQRHKAIPILNEKFPWVHRFQTANAVAEGAERRKRLDQYCDDFHAEALELALVIVKELALPPAQKTIPPANVGGIAGGTKYISKGILLKFAEDRQVRGRFLYGGDGPNLERAGKAAANELKGCNAFFSIFERESIPVLVPNQVLMDVGGWRIVAMPLVDLQEAQQIYGSNDGGLTVHNSDTAFSRVMQFAGQALNLAPHQVGLSGLSLPTAGDIEGHRAKDGSCLLLDLARTFPPEYPPTHLAEDPSAVFYKLLRPELLMRMDQQQRFQFPAVSADCFTGWGRVEDQKHNARAHHLSRALYSQIVERCANELDTLFVEDKLPTARALEVIQKEAPGLGEQWLEFPCKHGTLLKNLDGGVFFEGLKTYAKKEWERVKKDTPFPTIATPLWIRKSYNCLQIDFSFRLHAWGISMRHAGLVLNFCQQAGLRQILVLDLVSRTVKQLLRAHLRSPGNAGKLTEAAHRFLMIVVKGDNDTQTFWSRLPEELCKRFGSACHRHLGNLWEVVQPELPSLVGYICSTNGIGLNPLPTRVTVRHITPQALSVTARIRRMNHLSWVKAERCIDRALELNVDTAGSYEQFVDAVSQADQSCADILRESPDNVAASALSNACATVLRTLCKWTVLQSDEANLLRKVQKIMQRASMPGPPDRTMQLYLKAISFHAKHLQTFNVLLTTRGATFQTDVSHVQALIDNATQGATVVIPHGRYLHDRPLVLNMKKDFTLEAGGEVVFVSAANGPVLDIKKCSHVTIRGFTLIAEAPFNPGTDPMNAPGGSAVVVLSECKEVWIDGNEITGGKFGVQIQNSSDLQFTKNYIHHNPAAALWVLEANSLSARGNTIVSNGSEWHCLQGNLTTSTSENLVLANRGGSLYHAQLADLSFAELAPYVTLSKKAATKLEPGCDFEDIQDAINEATDGTVIEIPPGTYPTTRTLSVDDKKELMIRAKPGTVLIELSDCWEPCAKINNCHDIVLEGLALRHSKPLPMFECEGAVVEIQGEGRIYVTKCDLNGCGAVGINSWGEAPVYAWENEIHKNTLSAFMGQGLLRVWRNKIHSNGSVFYVCGNATFESFDNQIETTNTGQSTFESPFSRAINKLSLETTKTVKAVPELPWLALAIRNDFVDVAQYLLKNGSDVFLRGDATIVKHFPSLSTSLPVTNPLMRNVLTEFKATFAADKCEIFTGEPLSTALNQTIQPDVVDKINALGGRRALLQALVQGTKGLTHLLQTGVPLVESKQETQHTNIDNDEKFAEYNEGLRAEIREVQATLRTEKIDFMDFEERPGLDAWTESHNLQAYLNELRNLRDFEEVEEDEGC